MSAVPPVAPDADDARRWAEQELSGTEYQVAEPTPFDRLARTIGDAIGSIFSGDVPAGFGPWLAVGAIAIVVVLLVVAILIWGRPRRLVRSSAPAPLFGVAETRSADELRRDAEAAATAGRYDDALVLRVRALARSLLERTIVDLEPGATVQRFATTAATAFPDAAAELTAVARSFDDVRYLRRPGTPEAYARVRDLDERLARSRAEVLA